MHESCRSAPKRLSIVSGPTEPPLLQWTFNDILKRQCVAHAYRVAVASQHQGQSIIFSQLEQRSSRLANSLHSLGIGRGDRIAVMLGNRFEYVDIMFACSKIGAYFTLLNYACSSAELNNAMEATSPKVLFTTATTSRYNYRSMLESASRRTPSMRRILLLEDIANSRSAFCPSEMCISYDDLLAVDVQPSCIRAMSGEVQNADISTLMFTSGSTGLPKAAALTHHGMINSARHIVLQMRVTADDRIVISVPLFHAFGLIIGLCAALISGAATVLPSEYFDAGETQRAVEGFGGTGLYGVTTMFVDQMAHPAFSKTRRRSLRFGVMAGSSMPEDLLTRVMTKFPIPDLYTNWGMTELSSIATMTTASDPIAKKMRTAGQLLPNFVGKIVDPETGRVLTWERRGEIVISGFGVMHSYYARPDKTRQAIRTHPEDRLPGQAGPGSDGKPRRWMHTGDEGYLDADGYFVITGRIKDLIIRGGENISPLEIEARLYEHPSIKQAAVFGLPNARYGEEVAAMLELESGFGAPPDDAEIRNWVRQTLSRYKVPVRIWWLGDTRAGVPGEWPKTANGKLKKDAIRKIGEGLLERQAHQDTSRGRASL